MTDCRSERYFRSSDCAGHFLRLRQRPSAPAWSARDRRAGRRRACASPPPTSSTGTGLVVCDVCGPPVTGSRISSQLPWSAVTSIAPPCPAMASAIRPEPGVGGLHRLDRGRQAAGMPDHVGIGEVQHDHVVLAGVDRRDRLGGKLRRRHFRLQVVGRDLRRRHHDAVLAGVGLLAAAVEEVGDVRIFLGLGHAQLGAAGVGDHLAQDVREALRREDRAASACRALREYCAMPTAAANLIARLRGKPSNSGSSIAPRISRTRSARKLKHSTPSPSPCRRSRRSRRARRTRRIASWHRRRRSRPRVGKSRPVGLDDGRVGLADALPALVAIHRVVAAEHRRDLDRRRQRGDETLHVFAGRLRRRIAAVGDVVRDVGTPASARIFASAAP